MLDLKCSFDNLFFGGQLRWVANHYRPPVMGQERLPLQLTTVRRGGSLFGYCHAAAARIAVCKSLPYNSIENHPDTSLLSWATLEHQRMLK